MKTKTHTLHSTRLMAIACCLLLCAALPAAAQAPAKTALAKRIKYDTTKNGVIYKILTHNPNAKKANMGDIMTLNTTNTTIYDSLLGNRPGVTVQVAESKSKGDPTEIFSMLSLGDSACFLISIDSATRGQGIPPPFKHGDYYKINLKVTNIMTQQEYQQLQMAEQQKAAQGAALQIEDYIKTHNLKAQKTPSGLYYVIDTPGDGVQATAGKNVTVNYTGALLDGTVFDSNQKQEFGHVQPFSFPLGQGRVIKGWDEGIALFKKGGKGKLIIPADLAYGAQSPSPKIPANSPLVFDIEVVDVQ